jgi:hypothetical protein
MFLFLFLFNNSKPLLASPKERNNKTKYLKVTSINKSLLWRDLERSSLFIR